MPVAFDKQDVEKYISDYAKELSNAIKIIKNKEFNPEDQSKVISEYYSWNKAKERFIALHERL
jgi:hypothetical protein